MSQLLFLIIFSIIIFINAAKVFNERTLYLSAGESQKSINYTEILKTEY